MCIEKSWKIHKDDIVVIKNEGYLWESLWERKAALLQKEILLGSKVFMPLNVRARKKKAAI
jgi:hypothetical protein